MSAVAPAPPPVNPIPATNGVESTQPATTNNAGSAGEATTASAVQTPEEVGQKVFAGNLAYATTEDGLKQFFSAFTNEIISSEVIQRGPRPAGYGFVTFKTREAAEKAVTELHEKELDGRPVIVQLAKPSAEKEKERNERRNKRRATGRRNTKAPPGEVTEAEAEGQTEHSALQKAENAVEGAVAAVGEAIKPKKKKTNRKKKAKKAAAAAGEPAPGTENQGEASAAGEPGAATETTTEAASKKAKKPKAPKPTRPPRAVGEEPEGSPSKNMLFVANLAFSIDDARLKQIFTDAGVDVVSARVVQRRWGARRSKGFGFVDVGNEEEQKKALAYFAPVEGPDGTTTGKEVEGRQIAVKVAVDAPKKEAGETDADAAGSAAQKDDSSPDAIVVAH